MRKYWYLWIFVFLIVGIFFWSWLEDVEDNGREYALLEVGAILLYVAIGIVVLLLNVVYWSVIPWMVDKFLPKMPKAVYWLSFVLYLIIGLWLELTLVDGLHFVDDKYKDYQFQKQFEYKYNVEL